MECDTHVLVEEYIKDRREFNVAILKSKGKLIDSLVEEIEKMDFVVTMINIIKMMIMMILLREHILRIYQRL